MKTNQSKWIPGNLGISGNKKAEELCTNATSYNLLATKHFQTNKF